MRTLAFIFSLFFLGLGSMMAQVPERFQKREKKDTTVLEQKKPEAIVGSKDSAAGKVDNIWDRLVWGGNASLSFGNTTYIYLAPSVGYKISDDLIAGTGFIYQYLKLNFLYDYSTGSLVNVKDEDIEDQIYGPKFFVNYRFLNNFYLGSQFEYLNHNFDYYPTNSSQIRSENLWSPVLFLEGGLSQSIGKKGYAVLGIRFNLLDDIRSPYPSSWYPVIGLYF